MSSLASDSRNDESAAAYREGGGNPLEASLADDLNEASAILEEGGGLLVPAEPHGCQCDEVSGFGSRVSGFGFWVSGFGFRVSGFGLWVSVFRFRVSRCGLGV